MKVQIPDDLKNDVPPSKWGKLLSTTPVIMAVVATLLAGLASSEMTRAQYDRSYAAQLQSKAGDQWSYFQAKRLRGAVQRSSADLLSSVADVSGFSAAGLKQLAAGLPADDAAKADLDAALAAPATAAALALLERGDAPAAPAASIDPAVKAAIEAIDGEDPEKEAELALQAGNEALAQELKAAKARTREYDAVVKPVTQALDRLEALVAKLAAAHPRGDWTAMKRDFAAARLRVTAARYDTEARLNQEIAGIYEVQVRKSNLSAERHHRRSQRFFFGMLGAQLGVIISTVALAARRRNMLWSLAAAAGLVAVTFAGYVYIYV
jgi:hypothetical protein